MAEEQQKNLTTLLDSLGIELSVNGCGCCGSPWVSVRYKGEDVVADQDEFCFSNFKTED